MEETALENEEIKEKINVDDVEFFRVSVDPCGRVFKWKNRLFRAIYYDMVDEVRNMFSCGMIGELIDKRLFPNSWMTGFSIAGYGLVIEHEIINSVTYPFEWSFSMLKDAALTVLEINMTAVRYGYQTRDCHSYNICFDRTTPLFVDLGSFIRINEKKYWASYENFLRSYYYPLRIWSGGNTFLARKILFSLGLTDEMPHESYLLYKYPIVRTISLDILRQIVSHYFILRDRIPYKFMSFKKLKRKINSISLRESETKWGEYHKAYYDAAGNPVMNPRFSRIIDLIGSHNISSVIELGGNQGIFSEMLLKSSPVRKIICTDYDGKAVDAMYRNARDKVLSLTPAVIDIMYPLMNYYEAPPYERLKAEAVLALAVTHHIVLGQKLAIELFFEIVARYSKKFVFIEFMPLGLWDGKTAPPLPSWYNQDWFRAAFEKYFTVHLIEKLEENRVLFMGELKNP